MKISLNGNIIDEQNARLNITNKAVWYDFGIYESIKVLQGKIMWPEMHIDRLFNSARVIGMELGHTKEEVLKWINEFTRVGAENIQPLQNHLIKICAYGDVDKNKQANIYMFALGLTFLPDKFYNRGVKAITYTGQRNFENAKSKDVLLNFIALREAKKKDAYEAFMIDYENNVREGSRTNLFIVKDKTIFTPPKDVVLEGVTRTLVIDLIKKHLTNPPLTKGRLEGSNESIIEFREKKISLQKLLSADEIFITATSSNVLPVIQIDDKKIVTGSTGPITKQIIQLYRTMQKEYINEKN